MRPTVQAEMTLRGVVIANKRVVAIPTDTRKRGIASGTQTSANPTGIATLGIPKSGGTTLLVCPGEMRVTRQADANQSG